MNNNPNPFSAPSSQPSKPTQTNDPVQMATPSVAGMSQEAGNPFNNATQPGTTYGSGSSLQSTPHKSKKGLIIGLCSAVAVVIIAVVAVVLVIVLNGVSKKDYDEARGKAQSVADVMNEMSDYSTSLDSLSVDSVTEDEIDKISDKLNEYEKKISDGVKQLGETKAVKNDKDAKSKYDKLTSEWDKISPKFKLVADLYSDQGAKPMLLAIIDMMNVMKDNTSSITTTDGAISFYKKIGDAYTKVGTAAKKSNLSDSKINDTIHKIGDAYTEMGSICQQIAANPSNYSTLSDKIDEVSDNLETASDDFSKLMDETSDVNGDDMTKAINDLGQYLTDKTNGQK